VKAVFDTNVLVAAFLTEGICSRLLMRGRRNQFHLAVYPIILREFEKTLIKKFLATSDEAKEALRIASEAVQSVVQPSQSVEGVCRDPDDDAILACARAAGADYLVTGDADLLELGAFEEIRIVTPRQLELLFDD
jgi:putative PIN family toxin of toxin-antitoxin system